MQYIVDKLPTGLTVIRVPLAAPSVTALALVNTGRRYEPEKLGGISHFLEHLVFKGTDKYPTPQEVSLVIDEVGGEFNAFTGKEYTGYYVRLAASHVARALDVLTELVLCPQLRASDIAREAQVITEEINMYEDIPMRKVQTEFDNLLFAGSSLAEPILGTKDTINSLQSDDFSQYMQEWYGAANIVFVLAGEATTVLADSTLSLITTAWQKGHQTRQARATKYSFDCKYGQERVRIVNKATEQFHFIIGAPTFARTDERRYALSVLTNLLGQTMSARLFTEIREKRGLCYSIHADSTHFHDGGVFSVSAGVDTKRYREALAAVREELQATLNDRPPIDTEVQRAKQNIIGSMALQLEDSESVANWFGMRQLLYGEIQTPTQIQDKILAVTTAQVQAMAQEILRPDNFYTAIIGPLSPEQQAEIRENWASVTS